MTHLACLQALSMFLMHGLTSSASIFEEFNSFEGKTVINGVGNNVDVQNSDDN